MRDNFLLTNPDAILNIRNDLLQDAPLHAEFNSMMPDAKEETTQALWEHFVERISNLHGTEMATQITANLASSKRKTASAKCAKRPEGRTLNVKHEQLRAVKMQKKINIRTQPPPIDLTAEETEPRPTFEFVQTIECQFQLGQPVTANEGTGSASKQWKGVIVEVDHCAEVLIICCDNVPNYPHGYNMAVPFSETSERINKPLHSKKRKRKRNVIRSM